MAIKTVLVPVDGSPESLDTLNSAFLIANRFGAHVTALHVLHDSGKAVSQIADMMPVKLRGEVDSYVKNDARSHADQAKAQFEKFCADHNATISSDPATEGATAQWVEVSGEVSDILQRYGRLSDVIVVARPHKAGVAEHDLSRPGENLEALMLGTGRPMFIIPPSSEGHPVRTGAKNVVIGWNESLEASRALSVSIPWLPQMDSVTIAISKDREPRAQEVLDYLSWHGVKAQVKLLDESKNTSDSLLTICKEANADILVIGGFSHSRARERFFGGVTRRLLSKANIATLMVH